MRLKEGPLLKFWFVTIKIRILGEFMISWAQFKLNFEGKESKAFEDLAYLLFCTKHGQTEGIDRYFNQKGIETVPIEIDDECVGFQAKFYDTPLSKHKKELIDSIINAKSSFPKLSKIEFYINKDFGQNNKNNVNKPKYRLDIEKVAKKK